MKRADVIRLAAAAGFFITCDYDSGDADNAAALMNDGDDETDLFAMR